MRRWPVPGTADLAIRKPVPMGIGIKCILPSWKSRPVNLYLSLELRRFLMSKQKKEEDGGVTLGGALICLGYMLTSGALAVLIISTAIWALIHYFAWCVKTF
jgi:hypothetical protein